MAKQHYRKAVAKKSSKLVVDLKTLVACIALVAIVAYFGASFNAGATDGAWYRSVKSELTPPNYVFPIVWTILYVLIIASMYLALTKVDKAIGKKVSLTFGINLGANLLWSFLFFELKNPVLAFADIVVLWLSIVALIIVLRKTSKTAYYLLIPYFLWVSFAAVLNFLAIK